MQQRQRGTTGTTPADTKVVEKPYDYEDGGWVPELTVLSKSLPVSSRYMFNFSVKHRYRR